MASVHAAHLTPASHVALRKTFQKDTRWPHVAIDAFLTPQALSTTKASCVKGWKRHVRPDSFRHEVKAKVIVNDVIRVFVEKLLGRPVLRQSNRRFGHRDYTMHQREQQKAGIVAFFFPDDWRHDWGGDVVFVKAGTPVGRFTPRRNTLLIAERKNGVRSFIKYVNHRAGTHKLIVLS